MAASYEALRALPQAIKALHNQGHSRWAIISPKGDVKYWQHEPCYAQLPVALQTHWKNGGLFLVGYGGPEIKDQRLFGTSITPKGREEGFKIDDAFKINFGDIARMGYSIDRLSEAYLQYVMSDIFPYRDLMKKLVTKTPQDVGNSFIFEDIEDTDPSLLMHFCIALRWVNEHYRKSPIFYLLQQEYPKEVAFYLAEFYMRDEDSKGLMYIGAGLTGHSPFTNGNYESAILLGKGPTGPQKPLSDFIKSKEYIAHVWVKDLFQSKNVKLKLPFRGTLNEIADAAMKFKEGK